MTDNVKIYSFNELLSKLQNEHTDLCYYRGQTQIYNTPLWPSMYRGTGIINTMPMPLNLRRRCNRGQYFGFRSNYLVDKKYSNPENIKLRELKRCMMGYVRNALGYCLSEAMFQQAGWESEGLDVTTNIPIALFFATHKYNKGNYDKDLSFNTHVIYRWRIKTDYWDFHKLNKSDYNNCPIIFPSKQILDLFKECETIEEFKESIQEYRNVINWNMGVTYLDLQGKRPYEIIKIPRSWKMASRIKQQHAALLFPDSISFEEFNNHYSFNDVECQQMTENGGSFIEDLSRNYDCEIFMFRMDESDFDKIDVNNNQIYINEDISHSFLVGWMKSFHKNPYGCVNIMIPNGDSYLEAIDSSLNFSELRYSDNEHLFNG